MKILLGALIAAVLLPAADAIPDLPALLKDVRVHQQHLDRIRENYTFRRVIRTDELSGDGNVRSTKTEEQECFFVNGRLIARLVKKDGAALSPGAEAAEQDRVRRQIEKFSKAPAGSRGHTAVNLIGAVLPVAKISNPRRVLFNQRDTLTFDFAGDPNATAHGIVQQAAKKMSGTIWVDEAERQVARLQVRFDENFRIGGGLLASFRKGTTMDLYQSPVGEGLWLPSAIEQHVDARVALVKGFRENVHVKDSDFRKFDVGTIQQIQGPK